MMTKHGAWKPAGVWQEATPQAAVMAHVATPIYRRRVLQGSSREGMGERIHGKPRRGLAMFDNPGKSAATGLRF
jgi:hypothetical protein